MGRFHKMIIILFIWLMTPAFCKCAYALGFETEAVFHSVFIVYSGDSLGSGFAIGENILITNAHVIRNREDVRIVTYSGERQNASVVSMDEHIDIAVLYIPGAFYTPLQIEHLQGVSVGDDVYAIGAPNSLSFTLTKGIVSFKERYVKGQKYIRNYRKNHTH